MKISPLMWTALLVAGLSVAGCGKRPNHLDLPDDTPDDNFPHFYPSAKLDPQPDSSTVNRLDPMAPAAQGTMLSGMNNAMSNGLVLNTTVMSTPSNQGPMMSGGSGNTRPISNSH